MTIIDKDLLNIVSKEPVPVVLHHLKESSAELLVFLALFDVKQR